MSLDSLKKFVRERAIKGDDPDKLKEGLIANGWSVEDVDRVVSETYNLKKKIKKGFIILIVFLVVIFSLSLLLIFVDFSSFEEPENGGSGGVPIQNGEVSCDEIVDVSSKELCYLDKVKKGFMCDDLSSDEEFYCLRVLESFLMDSLE